MIIRRALHLPEGTPTKNLKARIRGALEKMEAAVSSGKLQLSGQLNFTDPRNLFKELPEESRELTSWHGEAKENGHHFHLYLGSGQGQREKGSLEARVHIGLRITMPDQTQVHYLIQPRGQPGRALFEERELHEVHPEEEELVKSVLRHFSMERKLPLPEKDPLAGIQDQHTKAHGKRRKMEELAQRERRRITLWLKEKLGNPH